MCGGYVLRSCGIFVGHGNRFVERLSCNVESSEYRFRRHFADGYRYCLWTLSKSLTHNCSVPLIDARSFDSALDRFVEIRMPSVASCVKVSLKERWILLQSCYVTGV